MYDMRSMRYELGYQDEHGIVRVHNHKLPGAFFVTRSDGKIFDDFTMQYGANVPLYYRILVSVDEEAKKVTGICYMVLQETT